MSFRHAEEHLRQPIGEPVCNVQPRLMLLLLKAAAWSDIVLSEVACRGPAPTARATARHLPHSVLSNTPTRCSSQLLITEWSAKMPGARPRVPMRQIS